MTNLTSTYKEGAGRKNGGPWSPTPPVRVRGSSKNG
jgi:hypothetical protein